ncbi:MAG: tRNA (adenosine(37)-N6)-threonylcarbamoyltransferase complex dimerization subunit type 1 TsaB [Desulfohalobiaceae bacterium]|nr:tRNA (adenosine(37)-N6)-threonylcarbamoyltransferase complex dimerization subunit type 1 TsaB [Desulfohalobiaceae bacterium]
MISLESSTVSKPILALNSAEDRVQLVLGLDLEILFAQEIRGSSRTIRVLPRALEHCFQETGVRPRELGGVACVLGPGTFTGLRVSIALAAGLARGASIPLAGLEYLPLLAAGPALHPGREVWVCTHARKGLLYVQGFCPSDGQALTRIAVLTLEEAADLIGKREQAVCLFGSGIRLYENFWRERLPAASRLNKRWDHPSPGCLLQRAEQAEYSREPLRPLYLRPADAEVNIPRIAALRGVDAGDFTKRIPDFAG